MGVAPINDTYWMQKAYDLALGAQKNNEVPVGALLIDENQQVIGQGFNQVIKTNDPTAHAEIVAIQNAAKLLDNYRLDNTTLYVTLEPCCMCAGAIVHARIKRLVFATRDVQAGAAGSAYHLLKGSPLNHRVQVDEGFLQKECAHLLTDFFKEKRL